MKILNSIEPSQKTVPQNTVIDLIIPGKIGSERIKIKDNKTFAALKHMRALRSIQFQAINDVKVLMPRDCYGIFFLLPVKTIDLRGMDTSKTTCMRLMFGCCHNLMRIDGLKNINTERVHYMDGMFLECENLLSLDLSGFNTRSVWDMSRMFDGCKNLSYLNLKNFDTRSVDYVNYMFRGCSSLSQIDLKDGEFAPWDTACYDFRGPQKPRKGTFKECISLCSVPDSSNYRTEDTCTDDINLLNPAADDYDPVSDVYDWY